MVADCLSRPAACLAAVPPYSGEKLYYSKFAVAHATCKSVAGLVRSPTLHVRRCTWGGVQLLCDFSTSDPRPLVPEEFQKKVFEAVHGLEHAGTRATKRLVSSRFVWRGMAAHVAQWCQECVGCARGKAGSTTAALPQPIAVPKERFCHVHVDIVGPLPPLPRGHTHLLSVIDRTSRWPELFPLRDTSARACADGVPETMTTDHGVQFTSEVGHVLCETLGIQHIKTTVYHPQSNGMVERLHRQVKEALRAQRCGSRWLEHLRWVLLGIRSAPKEEYGISAAEAVLGIPLTIPGQVARPAEKEGQPVINVKPRTYPEVAMPHPHSCTCAGGSQAHWDRQFLMGPTQ
jgi:hypothetical protein